MRKRFVLFVCMVMASSLQANWGGWSIDKEVFEFLVEHVPAGSTIVELGSGWASGELSKRYKVYSVEHDQKYLNKYNTNYIYAPIKKSWFDPRALEGKLPSKCAAILIDGPPGWIGRMGFADNLDLFDTSGYLIFDDVNRKAELALARRASRLLQRPYLIKEVEGGKQFAVIYPAK